MLNDTIYKIFTYLNTQKQFYEMKNNRLMVLEYDKIITAINLITRRQISF